MPLRPLLTITILGLGPACGGPALQDDTRIQVDEMSQLTLEDCINETCPRSGKPVVASSLATYRGFTVGFCNQHCRDDFAANVEERPRDRAFFDEILAQRE